MRIRMILRYGFLIVSMFLSGFLASVPGRLMRLQREMRQPLAPGRAAEPATGEREAPGAATAEAEGT